MVAYLTTGITWLCLLSSLGSIASARRVDLLTKSYPSFEHVVEAAGKGAFLPHVNFQFDRKSLKKHISAKLKSEPGSNHDKHLDALLAEIAEAANLGKPRRIFRTGEKHAQRHAAYGLDMWFRAPVLNPHEAAGVSVDMKTEVKESHATLASLIKLLDGEHSNFFKVVEPRLRVELKEYTTDDPDLSLQDHYETINLYDAWDITAGNSDIVVQVVDTGIDTTHEDLQNNKWINSGEDCDNGIDDDGNGYTDDCYGYDFADDSSSVEADHFHGVHCAGTVAADNDNAIGVAGVAGGKGGAAGASIMVGQVFGRTTDDGFDEALIYGADNGAHISSNSWGYTSSGYYESSVETAIQYAVDAGVLVVFAAGNDGTNEDWYPGYDPNTISVAAVDSDGIAASFTNYGDWINISAPGVSVYSTVLDSSYGYASGTSMACPHVSGILALGLSYAQDLGFDVSLTSTREAVRDCMYETAADVDSSNSAYAGLLGHGLTDVPAMFDCLGTQSPTISPPPTISPVPTRAPTLQPTANPTTQCGVCSYTAVLQVTTDEYASETGYTLTEAGAAGDCDVVVDIEETSPFSDDSTFYSIILSENLCAGQSYTFTMTDSFGDGMCCDYGDGSYRLYIEGEEVASGGEFTSSDSTTFTVNSDWDITCSASTCESLDWDSTTYGSSYICGASSKTVTGSCLDEQTWEEAEDFCAGIGARLCNEEELLNDEARGTGCKLDSALVWTETSCDTDSYYAVLGSGKKSGDLTCTDKDSTGVSVRCCADSSDRPVCQGPTPAPTPNSGDCTISSCDDLGWDATSYGSTSVCGGLYKPCLGDTTWSDSSELCSAMGARLCTVDELHDDEARQTGCHLDSSLVWSSDSCGTDSYYATYGSIKAGTTSTCLSSDSTGVSFRCCASTVSCGTAACSSSSCTDLGWDMTTYGGSETCGSSSSGLPSVGNCVGDISWADSALLCAADGARLCTLSELKDDEARGTGCKLNKALVWSAESCGDNKFYATYGSSLVSGNQCLSGETSGVSVRCCADEVCSDSTPSAEAASLRGTSA